MTPKAGADFITLPECTGLMEPNAEAEKAPAEEDHLVLALKGENGGDGALGSDRVIAVKLRMVKSSIEATLSALMAALRQL